MDSKIRSINPLIDEEGKKLPKNMSKQFRDVQTGIEYLKDSSDTIIVELKSVTHKLKNNTTDLSQISKKVNEIEDNLKTLNKTVSSGFEAIGSSLQALIKVITVIGEVPNKK